MHNPFRSASSRLLQAALCGSSVLAASLLAAPALLAQSTPASSSSNLASQQSPFGGQTVEDIIARVNDRIISSSDYNRALEEMDQDARQHGESMQQIADAHKDLLRNLIDQQLWLSKGKELGITGETELVKQLDEIRKKYNLATMEDLEKAAQQQGVSFEDFKSNLLDQIITQDVMRQEVGSKVNVTPGEAYRYYQEHPQDFSQPESVHLAEILVSTTPAAGANSQQSSDSARLALAKAKADDIEARLKAGANFDQLARTESDGSTAAEGGDLGKYGRGSLAKVLEDATFSLKAGQFTQPIRTRQGYVILKVLEHTPGGVAPFKQVQSQAEQAYFMTQMQPAIRQYLTQMREQAYIDIRPGYTDTGASPLETKPIYSAYTPPSPKKKKKAERARYRETDHGFRAKGEPKPLSLTPASLDTSKPAATPAAQSTTATGKHKKKKKKQQKPRVLTSGKKEKIRYGQAPMETLPDTPRTRLEDAGAVQTADASDSLPNPLDQAPVRRHKTRFSDRGRTVTEKTPKAKKKSKKDAFFNQAEDQYAPAPPDPTEVANQQLQSAPLGLNGDTSPKKKKKKAEKVEVVGQPKTRLQNTRKKKAPKQQPQYTPAGPVTGAPAPAATPASAPAAAPDNTTTPAPATSPSGANQ